MAHETIDYWHHPIAPGIEISRAHLTDFSFERHVHLDYHIGIVSQGAQSYRHKGSQYQLHSGILSTLNPDETHDGQRHSEQTYVAKVMSIPHGFISTIAQELGFTECFFKQPLIKSDAIYQGFSQLHDGLSSHRQLFSDLEIETRLLAITTQLLIDNAVQDKALNQSQKLTQGQLDRIKLRFISAPEQNIQLAELANELNLSKFQLLRQFKQAVGMTPHAYQHRIRLEQAKKAIVQGEKLSDIAHDVGFFDQSHFNRAFKRAFLLTPSQFQKRVL